MRQMQRSHDAASLADLQTAIMEVEKALPGWWYSLGICSVSRDASCGPDIAGPDATLAQQVRKFDAGFHCDDHHPDSTMADALRNVMTQALEAKARLREKRSVADDPEAVVMRDREGERAIAATPEALAMRERVLQALTDYWNCLDRHGLINDEKRNSQRDRMLHFVDHVLAYDLG